MWSVYVIWSSSGKLYTGVSTDVNRRFRQHLGELKGGAKFFRSDRPSLLVHEEKGFSRTDAQVREAQIKKLSRLEKEHLVFGKK